jgi:hypothetical protein
MTGLVASLPSRIALHCAVVMLAGIIATPAFTSDGQPFGKWFKYSPGTDTMWDITGDPADPMHVVLRQKKAEGPLKRILVLYPRPSSAYDTAITEILRVFATKEINADITVVNFELDDARGRAALLNAEKSKDDLIIAMGSESTAWVDSKNISAVQTQAEPVAAYAKQSGLQVIWGSVQNPDNAREELTRIIPSAVSTMRKTDPDLSESLFWITGSTSVFREIRTINQYSDRVPVLSVVPEIVTKGADTAVLAIGISFESNAQLAAIYSARILDGVKPGTLKVGIVSPPDIAISFLKAREIGMRVPFNFFEIAGFIYDYQGREVRAANKFESEPSQ